MQLLTFLALCSTAVLACPTPHHHTTSSVMAASSISTASSVATALSDATGSSRTTAPSGALVVAKSGGKYSKIQDAVDALSTSSTSPQSIFIEAGVYDEQVYIPSRKASLSIYGYTKDTSSYEGNQVNITYGLGLNSVSTDDETATVRAWSSNFKMYNVNLINTRGQGSQALAVSASAGDQGYYACQFHGYQDTILAETGSQLYARSLIVGSTDFIFGQHATAWFSECDIRVLSASLGYVTASGRASSSDPSYYVLDHCTIDAFGGNSVDTGAYYLGRPWEDYARVAVQDTSMSSVINSKGWSVWGSSDPNTDHVSFGEYGNTGAGAEGTRATFASKLSEPVAISSILGSGYASAEWVDTAYLS